MNNLKLHSATITDYAGIKGTVEFNFGGKSSAFQILGANGAGKSSFSDGILAAIQGKSALPNMPVNLSAGKAKIQLKLGNENIEVTINKEILPDRTQKLSIALADGTKITKQSFLDDMIKISSFEPMDFCRAKPEEQKKQLADLLGLTQLIAELEANEKTLFDDRIIVNRDVNKLKAQLEGIILPQNCPMTELSVLDISNGIEAANSTNRYNQEMKIKLAGLQDVYKQSQEQAKQKTVTLENEIHILELMLTAAKKTLDTHIVESKTTLEQLKIEGVNMRSLVDSLQDIDVVQLKEQISGIEETNRLARLYNQKQALQSAFDKANQEATEKTAAIESIRLEKSNAVKNARLPIAGLEFAEKGLLFEGVPLEQINTAQQIIVGMSVAMAQNPTIRVIRIKDGSLIGHENRQLIERLAIENNYQVLLEVVTDSDSAEIVIKEGVE